AEIAGTSGEVNVAEHRPAPFVDGRHSALKHGLDEVVAGPEVVLGRGAIVLGGGAGDLTQRDAIDASLGEEPFGGADQGLARLDAPAARAARRSSAPVRARFVHCFGIHWAPCE